MSEFARRSQENNAVTYRHIARYYARELKRIAEAKDASAELLRKIASETLDKTRGKLK